MIVGLNRIGIIAEMKRSQNERITNLAKIINYETLLISHQQQTKIKP